GEACPTDSGFKLDQDRANIAKTSTLPGNSTPKVTSLAADEGKGATATVSIPTGSGVVSTTSPTIPTAAPIFTTVTESTPCIRKKGKETMVESETPKKKKKKVLEEKLKEMMELIPVKEVYVEALQVKHPIIDWEVHTEGQRSYWKIIRLGVKETLSIRPPVNDKEKELWVELKRLYELDVKDLLWTHTQNLMHAPVEWKLYDTCRVHHVISKDQEMYMLVEKDYPLRKGLAIGMISYKLQVENYSQMANALIMKIYKIASSPRQQDD
nr:hypothetical protein [Tanacetum cinerariifolium]